MIVTVAISGLIVTPGSLDWIITVNVLLLSEILSCFKGIQMQYIGSSFLQCHGSLNTSKVTFSVTGTKSKYSCDKMRDKQ